MRSRTDLLRVPRCDRCALPVAVCLCAEVEPVATVVEVAIVRHVLELPKSTNTGRIAALALSRATVHDYGRKEARFDPARLDLAGAGLLFPGGDPAAPPAGVKTLVVLDASWPQAKGMFARTSAFHRLPRVSVAPPAAAPIRLRHTDDPARMGTLEALVAALRLLGEPAAADRLDAVRVLHVARILATRGRRHPHVRPPDHPPAGTRGPTD